MKNKSFQRVSVGASVAAILAGAAMASYSPGARSAEEADELGEVTVTGSRIQRRDYVSNSPLVTIESESFESRTGLNVESYLNQLPNFNPANSPVTTQGDVQITPVNSVGIASVSLRGFGPNRNLVLVDGHRPVPINSLMVVDTNGIPTALVERVEIISGGASAVYGADAIGGVTNFILRDDFEGFQFDVQTGMAETGDAEETRLYAVLGTNFADGRGNVTMAAEHYDRKIAYERERDFYKDAWSDPTVGGDFFVFGYNGYNAAFSFAPPSTAVLNAIFADRPTYPATDPVTGLPNPAAGQQTGVRGFGNTFGIFEGYRFNKDGSAFTTGSGNNLYKFTEGGGVIDNYKWATQRAYDGTLATQGQPMDVLKWNNTDAYVSAPQERYSLFASGRFQITDSVEFYARGNFSESKTKTKLFPANASYGWEAQVPYNPTTDSPLDPSLNYQDQAVVAAALANPAAYANPGFIPTGAAGAQHPVSVEFAAMLNSRLQFGAIPAANTPWVLETYPNDSFDDRATTNTNSVWQIDAGVRFDLPFGDWNGDVYVSHGESATYNEAYGNNSLTRWRKLVTQPDYGRNATLESNQANTSPTPPASAGFGGAIVHCTSGFYDMIFAGDSRPSEDCRTAVQANLQTRTHNTQDIAEASFQGGLFDMWAGQVRAAAGIQYRQNASKFTPDILQSTSSFMDQVIGVYPTGYLDAETSVMDYYGEMLVPLISDAKFMKRLELELGGRYSDYEDTESTWTYKVTANAQITDAFRLRGGYNRATRAPNLGELFLNTQEIFTFGGNFGDSCGLRSNAPFGAGGAQDANGNLVLDPVMTPGETNPQLAAGQTQAGANSSYLICQAQMGAAGSTSYYSQNQAQPGAGGGFAWVLQQGNYDLESEKADTWTAGLVWTPQFESAWLSGLSASVDWWSVDISDAIQQYSIDYANFRCYGTEIVTNATDAARRAASNECQNVGRNQSNGGGTTVLLEYDNAATIKTSGIDFALNWFSQFGDMGLESVPGGIGFNIQGTWLDYYKTKASPAVYDVETDWVGTLGPNLTGTNPGAYRYRLFSSLNYMVNDFSASLRWRHLPSVWTAGKASEDAIIKNNEAVAAGGEGILLSYTPTAALEAGSYDIFDLSFNWNINPTVSIRGGIDNLFDVEPEITGASAGRPYDPTLSAAQNLANRNAVCSDDAKTKGCVSPNAYSLPSTGAGLTSPGYYDTIGRRYFVGVKISF